jgi:2-oxoglutarate ferredoxin oxidoreductase subunit delta
MTTKRKLKKRGIVHILKERCKECGFCIWLCPLKALKRSKETNRYRYHYPIWIGQCIACRKCEEICPDFAIFVEEVGDSN